jgi:hypothetical protein
MWSRAGRAQALPPRSRLRAVWMRAVPACRWLERCSARFEVPRSREPVTHAVEEAGDPGPVGSHVDQEETFLAWIRADTEPKRVPRRAAVRIFDHLDPYTEAKLYQASEPAPGTPIPLWDNMSQSTIALVRYVIGRLLGPESAEPNVSGDLFTTFPHPQKRCAAAVLDVDIPLAHNTFQHGQGASLPIASGHIEVMRIHC